MACYARKDVLEDFCMFHITWRCHNKSFFLKGSEEKKFYYNLLLKNHKKYGVQIFAYSIMSNHIHLAGKCDELKRLSAFFQKINTSFAKFINKKLSRTGQVIMDRFKSPMIEDNSALLKVTNYIELNSYKAKMVKHPKNYFWSSYRHYAFGLKDDLITNSPVFLEFGNTDYERREIYKEMIDELLSKELVHENFSKTYFIGDPAWVEYKYNTIRLNRKTFVSCSEKRSP